MPEFARVLELASQALPACVACDRALVDGRPALPGPLADEPSVCADCVEKVSRDLVACGLVLALGEAIAPAPGDEAASSEDRS